MQRIPILAAAVAVATTALAEPAPSPIAGYDQLDVTAPHRARPVAASFWYPVGTKTYRGLIGDNPVFYGTSAYVGAAIADGRHPLVLVSHGSGGNMDGLSWLSSQLALRGAIVLAVNHPGSTSGDSSPRRSILLDERASDLSVALDRLLADPALADHIDTERISVLGFSLGGSTALSLAGARMNRGSYQDYCGRFEDAEDCVFLTKGGVDLAALPPSWEEDMRDPRVSSSIAVDPGLTDAMTLDSIAAMNNPVLLINLGDDERWRAIDVGPNGSNLAGLLPDATYETVAPANHFTFLGLCKPEGRQLLIEEKDDPVCDEPDGGDRAKAHESVIDAVATFLKL